MADTILYSSTNQASAILTSTTQGPSGSLSSPTGTGFVHVTSGAIDGAARAVNVGSADVTGTLLYTNGGTGLSTLGTAYQVLQVNSTGTALQYGSVPLAQIVAPTGTGVALVSGGVWAAAAGTINLASSTYVSGLLPNANVAPGSSGQVMLTNASPATAWTTLTGDVAAISGAGAVQVQSAQYGQTGALTFGASTGTITAASTATAAGLTQTATSSATPAPMVIAPQGSSAGTTANGAVLNINLAAPGATGTYDVMFNLQRGGTTFGALGPYPTAYSNTYCGLWVGQNAVSPSTTNYSFMGYASGGLGYSYFNSITQTRFNIGNTTTLNQQAAGFQFFGSVSTDFGGGSGVIGISKASTNPSTATTGSVLYADSSTGALGIWAPGDTTAKGPTLSIASGAVSGGLGQAFTLGIAPTTASSANLLTIAGQQINYAGAVGGALSILSGASVTTGTSGNLVLGTGAAATGGNVSIQTAGGSTSGLITITTNNSAPATGGNIQLQTGGSTTSGNISLNTLSAATIGTISVNPGGTNVLQANGFGVQWGVNPSAWAFGTAGGTYTVTTATMIYPVQVLTSGTLTATAVLDFTTVCTTTSRSGFWLLDISGMVIGTTYGLTVKNGTASMTFATNLAITTTLVAVNIRGSNTLAVTAL